ncbi:MAG TPA: hypothetical protein VGT61_14470 [Thermomicrobiales bacterium]|jgi:hypothetical protein|nr:hypothetical protein [Thermomicrobiales bacterium]
MGTPAADPDGAWESLSVAEIEELFRDIAVPWWIAGGHAIDLAAGWTTRDHADIDVLILRRDHLAVHEHLSTWDCYAADPPGSLRRWSTGEPLPDHVHDVWSRADPDDRWRFQLMVDESDGDGWYSRRDRRITRRLTDIGATSADGVPYLRPEIQLFYKSRGRRPKDEADLITALPLLDAGATGWLREAIRLTAGDDHPWLARIAGAGPT